MDMRTHCVAILAAAALVSSSAVASVIQTNEGITSSALAYAAATDIDPAGYLYNAGYDKDWTTAIIVGGTSSTNGGCDYVQLRIESGSVINSSATGSTGITYIGINNAASAHNSIVITGAGASMSLGGALRVGSSGSYNNLTIENGASLSNAGDLVVGYGSGTADTGSYNSMVVNGGTVNDSGRKFYLGYQDNAAYNTLTISNGGVVTAGGPAIHTSLGRYGDHNNITVTGPGSRFVQADGNLYVTYDGTNSRGDNNTLTTEAGALVQIISSVSAGLSVATTSAGNFVQFNQGFLAWNGDHTTTGLNVLTQVQLWDGSAYASPTTSEQAAALGWTKTFYAADVAGEAAALAATGYSGLGGYTVFTGGAIPEPATLSLLVAVGSLLTLARRSRRFPL